MRNQLLILTTLFITAISTSTALAQQVADFESQTGFDNFGPTGQFFNGYGAGATTGSFTADGLTFPTQEFGPGWSYSQVIDTTTPDFTNQFAAFPGSGSEGSATYALAFGSGASFTAPDTIQSLDITNGTFSYFAIRDGNQFSSPFGGDTGTDPDFFLLTINGFDASGSATGSQEFFLADFRSADPAEDFIIDDWQTVDVSGLNATSLSFDFSGSDTSVFDGQEFLNTPTYFAADNIVIGAAIPEPSSLLLTLSGVSGFLLRRRRS